MKLDQSKRYPDQARKRGASGLARLWTCWRSWRDREASLKTFIGGYMKAQKIDDVQTRGGTKVTQKTSVKKPAITKKILMDELPNYIEGGQERLNQIIKEIEDKLEPKESSTLQLKLKKKSEE